MVRIKLRSINSPSASLSLDAHVLSQLTACLPSISLNSLSWPSLSNLALADPDFLTSGPIDLLLGVDCYSQLIKPNIIRHPQGNLIAQDTQFGWVLLGQLPSSYHSLNVSTDNSDISYIHDLLVKFWELEEIPSNQLSSSVHLSPDELLCEQHFLDTHRRKSDGRYVVRLPFQRSPTSLGDSRATAHSQLRSLLTRLSRSSSYSRLYHEFMDEYRSMRHLRQLNSPPLDDHPQFYLPHHGIMKPSENSSKIRVVFNGSSKTSSNTSLNDLLHTGARLQANLFDILLYFRQYEFVFITDIAKMFRQIEMHPDDCRYQRILWLDDQQLISPHELTTVTYGTRSAPFLAGRVLHQLVQDEGHRFPLAIEPMTKGRYVDDISGGADDLEQLKCVALQLTQLCKAGGFPLAKWKSNHPQLLASAASSSESTAEHFFDSPDCKILGLLWISYSDVFKFNLQLTPSTTLTKRSILSEIARIFDPLGLISPIVIQAKVILQSLWLEKLNWDDPLSPRLSQKWIHFQNSLNHLSLIAIPRWMHLSSSTQQVQLHGFADASKLALAAVVYLRSTDQHDVRVRLVCAKTKVAPLKPCTIPRLELAACALLAKLVTQICATLHIPDQEIFLWTDSSVALSWIKDHPSRWKDFVRNRVHLIQETLPAAKWCLTPGTQNPADCASRGMTSSQLSSHDLWWNGPPWLSLANSHWPSLTPKITNPILKEERPGSSFLTRPREHHQWDLLTRYSSLKRLLTITSICQKAVNKFKRQPSQPKPTSDPENHERALLFWIHSTQQTFFADTIHDLSNGYSLSNSNPLISFTPFLDHKGTLRLGGRLKHSYLDPDAKHPIILPRHCPLSDLLIADAHTRTLHGGTQVTMASLRQRYWILGGRAPVRSHILKCIKCARHRSTRAQQLMGQLPTVRVTPSRPFLHTGVDYAGPVTLKTRSGRGAKTYKGWLSIFTCFSTSAVHLEVVSDYSANAFLAAYRRLVGRRGICQSLYSDCGTTFQGANSTLKQLFSDASRDHAHLKQLLANDGTSWRFNPPAAPHFGGKWEAAVKWVKFHLSRTIGDTPLTFEELTTLLVQIESVLNSRPLSALSDDPDDLTALTPGHFLIGQALNTIPEPSLIDTATSRLDRWQFLQQRLQYFWSRWSAECLQRHLSRSKWFHQFNEIKVGSLVLLTNEHTPPSKWPLARVIQLHPGTDGLTRVVTIRTASTTLKRPIAKLAILPLHPPDDFTDSPPTSTTSDNTVAIAGEKC